MSLTRNTTRRTAGTVSLLAALLLVLNALFVLNPAQAAAQDPPVGECPGDFVKIDTQSDTNTDLTVGNYDFNNASVGEKIYVKDGSDTVITVEIIAVKTGDETTSVKVSLDGDADFAITEIVLKTGASSDADGDTPTLLPGESVTVNTGEGGGNGLSHLTLCLGEVPDTEVTPADPTFVDPDCDNDNVADVVLPETTGVSYAIEGTVAPGESVKVTATAEEGYVLTGTTEWNHDFPEAETDCDPPTEVTPLEPTFTNPVCDDLEASLVLPEGPEGVTYEVDGTVGPGETVTVTAVAGEGYVFPEGATTEWTHDYGAAPTNCDPEPEPEPEPTTDVDPDVVVRPAVSFLDPSCDDPDQAEVVVTEVDGITYTITGDEEVGGTVTITAAAQEGYTIPASAQSTWTHTFDAPENCTQVAPEATEKPQPAPQPAPEVQAQELAATGLDSMELFLLALLLFGLGAAALLAPEPRRQA